MHPALTVAPDVAAACASAFVEIVRLAISTRGRAVVALTGGRTALPIYRTLAGQTDLDWSRVEIFFSDERAVPPSDPRSNFTGAHETLLAHVPARAFRIEGERADLHAVAREYEQALRASCEGELDLMLISIGHDAHVLSLWPGSPDLDESVALVKATIDPPMDPAVSRITMTPPVIQRARRVVAIATGKSKRRALHDTLQAPTDRRRCPAHVLREARDVRFIADVEAAG